MISIKVLISARLAVKWAAALSVNRNQKLPYQIFRTNYLHWPAQGYRQNTEGSVPSKAEVRRSYVTSKEKQKMCDAPQQCECQVFAESACVCVIADRALPGMLKQVFRIEVASLTHSYPTLNESSMLEIHWLTYGLRLVVCFARLF